MIKTLRDLKTTSIMALGVMIVASLPTADAEGGTLRVPSEYSSIHDAVSAAASGDSILVDPGVYTNCDGGPCLSRVATLKPNLVIASVAGKDVTEIRMDSGSGGSTMLVGFGTSDVVIDGFTFRCTVDRYYGVTFVDGTNIRIANCDFVEIVPNYPKPVAGGAIFLNGGSNLIENCRFLRCDSSGGSCIFMSNSSSTSIAYCTFEDCVGTAVVFTGTTTSNFTLRNSMFLRNTTPSQAGALTLTDVASGLVEDNVFIENRGFAIGGAVACGNSESTIHLRRNVFFANRSSSGGGALAWAASGSISNNTFVGNFIDGSGSRYGSAIVHNAQPTESTLLSNNIFVGNYGDVAVESVLISTINSCNLFWDNPDGNYTNYTPSPTDLFADPEFCNAAAEDFTLRSSSPCLPGGTPTCGLIGAFGEGCGGVAVESTSWGKIKGLYR